MENIIKEKENKIKEAENEVKNSIIERYEEQIKSLEKTVETQSDDIFKLLDERNEKDEIINNNKKEYENNIDLKIKENKLLEENINKLR